MNHPWFKAYAADYLLDSKIDAIPPEAEGLIWRIWCVCHLDGFCPSDPGELARKIRRPVEYVLKYKSYYESLFELKGTSYVSPRMEKEKRRSETNRNNVRHRYQQRSSGIRSTTGSTDRRDFVVPPSDYDSDSGLEVDLELKVLEVAKLYPAIADPFHLSREHAGLIVDALVRHGEKVLDGVKRFRACYDRWPQSEYKFLPSVKKFFSESQYVFESVRWEKGNGDTSSKAQQRVVNNRKAIILGLSNIPESGSSEPDLQDGDVAGGSPRLEEGHVGR